MRNDEGNADHEIGRGRPPKAKRWKPGVSGNPAGRPSDKGKSVQSVLDEVLAEAAPTKNGKAGATVLDSFMSAVMASALKGNQRSVRKVLDLAEKADRLRDAKKFIGGAIFLPDDPEHTAIRAELEAKRNESETKHTTGSPATP
jgi:Family of unknown function (DUF5681)